MRFQGDGESNDAAWMERAFESWAATRFEFPAERARDISYGRDLTPHLGRSIKHGYVPRKSAPNLLETIVLN